MRRRLDTTDILAALKALRTEGFDAVSSSDIQVRAGGSHASIGRLLGKLVENGTIARVGKARATRYFLPSTLEGASGRERDQNFVTSAHTWSAKARAVFDRLNRPLGARLPVTYQRDFVDAYAPNQSFLLPNDLAVTLAQEGRMSGQQPAGTYTRKVLEQLLIDLSWSSSRLEGNTYSLLATEELFKSGAQPDDAEGVMLLNHKRAIEFLVDAVPSYGLTDSVVRNLHALLMQDLLDKPEGLGAIRNKVVNISDSTYIPLQIPQLLEEMLTIIINKAQYIKNPVEAAFFLWTNVAYLQPFEDGKKRTSRLAANVPLMLYNCAPLSFLDVDPRDYAMAMLALYELRDITIATELFVWTYRRSIRRYQVILEATGSPDEFRIRHREHLSEAVQRIVRNSQPLQRAVAAIGLKKEETDAFKAMLEAELRILTPYNCARYRITLAEVQAWIERGKPQ